jgi:mono/diheme cytochrome c family protein
MLNNLAHPAPHRPPSTDGPAMLSLRLACMPWVLLVSSSAIAGDPLKPVDYNRDIRPILSDACFRCHGPDAKQRKGLKMPLRLDTEDGATADLGGHAAIVREKPDESEVIARITSQDEDRMPPASTGRKLSKVEIDVLTRWIKQGAPYARHWSYSKPIRPALPKVSDAKWGRGDLDRFVMEKLESEGLKPTAEADRPALIRRVALDLTGLPPTIEEVDAFMKDEAPNAYERLVDRLLAKPSYGEYWGRLWLDLARYADSAGYADDPPRTIWAYRDWVVRSFNANMPFRQFTIEQLAGDLLPNPSDDQLTATAFHRNTLTNNEGGTNDEEFRTVAVVDRVNTTMAVWMGTTIACAQCHDHKYDPLSQKEYFQLYAFFNNTEDADRTDESPFLSIYSTEKKKQKTALTGEIASLEAILVNPTPELIASQEKWEQALPTAFNWQALKSIDTVSKAGAASSTLDDGSTLIKSAGKTDVYTISTPITTKSLTAIRLETLPHDSLPGKGSGYGGGNFVVTNVSASITPPESAKPKVRFVRIELPGKAKFLSLAEVEVYKGSDNIALKGEAKQSNTDFDGPAKLAIDGNTNGQYVEAKSTTHTALSDDPWWELDLKVETPIDRVKLWNRTDSGLQFRLAGCRVVLLNDKHEPIWNRTIAEAPNPSAELAISGDRLIEFSSATADYSQASFDAANVLNNAKSKELGWAIGGATTVPHQLTLITKQPVEVESGSTLNLTIEQTSKHENHTIGRFRLDLTDDPSVTQIAKIPVPILAMLNVEFAKRTDAQKAELSRYYLTIAPELKESRERLMTRKKQLADLKPDTTVPIARENTSAAKRKTNVQLRGNFLDLGEEVAEGVPKAFPPLPADGPRDRLALAKWLMNDDNPMTARVVANRYWEQIFGVGLVGSSEDFGAQGDLPSHPELLDWLATELIREDWNLKAFLRLLVTSATYRQSSRVSPEMTHRDPENRLLSRGPRLRLPAETIRDQALAVAGLLSPKIGGPPVKPPQPSSGLSAAFGGKIDWETSTGEDRYRRGIYTSWRRSNPYPSMTTFDAPNRETCTLKRSRTNTPLQALVTLNDPVFVEAAQALARRMNQGDAAIAEKARKGFRLTLARNPSDEEVRRLVRLFETTKATYDIDPAKAEKLATAPLGPLPKGANAAELAAWTVVANVLLNLDETLMKP